jgi:iron complex outermembrane recepter protein
MKSRKLVLWSLSLAAVTALNAADGYKLQEVTAVGSTEQAIGFEFGNKDNINSQGFNKNSIEVFGKSVNTTPMQIINMSPSINFNSVDIFGENESSYHEPVRIRGRNQSGPGGIITLEGLPVAGNPGGGKTIYDMENFSGIDLYKGYVPVDKSLGFTNLIGKVDLIIDRPSDKFGGSISQMLGSDNAARTYLRVDSGKVGNTSVFASVSQTNGDKWKGEGDLSRTNGMVGLAYTPTSSLKMEFYAVQNRDDHHNYYTMNFAQATDLGANYSKDWSGSRPTVANNPDYYDWNKQSFEDTVLIANVEYKIDNSSKITLSPYYTKDKGEYWYSNRTDTNAAARVVQWILDHDAYGAVLKYQKEFSREANMKLGYWYGKKQPPGPPVSQRKYTVDASGNLVWNGWNMLAKNDYQEFNSPFVEFSGEKDKWSYSAGLRYLNFKLGALRSYTNGTTAATSSSYDAAMSGATLDAMASISAITYTEWLPSMYVSYKFNNDLSAYFDYTRSYGYDVNLFPAYVSGRATYAAKNVTLQQLFDKQKLEISDNFDIGAKITHNGVTYTPNIYMFVVSGKQATVYDPALAVSYATNNLNAMAYGAEFAASGAITKDIDFMASAAYGRYYYTDDLKTSATATQSVSGNQIPDSPKYSAKGALTYKLGEWKFTPMLRYNGERYGNVDNSQKIPAFTVVDMDISYTKPKLFGSKEGVIRLSMINLFNNKYISTIVTPDNALITDTTQPSYQAGAPFGAYLSANFKF